MAPSVAGLQRSVGNGAMSNSIVEIEDTKCIFIFGYNAADSHPIVARRIVKAKEKGTLNYWFRPARHIESARLADIHLALKNGSNIALINALAHVIIAAETCTIKPSLTASHTEQFEEYRKLVEPHTPEPVNGSDHRSGKLRISANSCMYAKAENAVILWYGCDAVLSGWKLSAH